MNWLFTLLFPSTRRSIRINPNHLPGLTPPKAASFTPMPPKPVEPEGPAIHDLYKKFREATGSSPKKRNPKGWEF